MFNNPSKLKNYIIETYNYTGKFPEFIELPIDEFLDAITTFDSVYRKVEADSNGVANYYFLGVKLIPVKNIDYGVQNS